VGRLGVWRNADFLKLWTGHVVSTTGSQLGFLAVGLTAAVALGASPAEMGVLGMLRSVPFLLFGLFAGAWADRLSRRPLLIASDIGRAALILSVPLAFVLGYLSLWQLYVVSFGVGTLNVVFAVAYVPYVPVVVRREDLLDANAKLMIGESVARVSGPSIAGGLIQLLTAPIALIVDAVSFVVSAVALKWIKAREPAPNGKNGTSIWAEIKEGLRVVGQHRLLLPITGSAAWGNLGDGVVSESGILLLFMTRDLRLDAGVIGGLLAAVGIGGVLSAPLIAPLSTRFGPGPMLVGGMALWAIGYGALGLVPDSPVAVPLLGLLLGALGTINPLASTNSMTLRQAVTPNRLLGRVTSVSRVALWGAIALGSLLGGLLADAIGLRATLVIGGVLPLIGFLWLVLSPVRRVRRLDSLQPACSSDS
jgi:MFS family permease